MKLLKIEIKEDIYTLMGKNSVYFKENIFYIGELNYYSLMKIIKLQNNNLYNELIKNKEICKYAFNSLIFDNKGLKPEEIVDFILNSNIDEIINIGNDYKDYLFEILKTTKFEKDKFKGLIYDDLKMDYEFMFSQFPELKVLFIYDENNDILNILDRTGRIIKKQKINESDMYVKFEYFKESNLKVETDNYWNKLLKDIINRLFNLELFFEEFKEEIFKRIAQILMIVDLSEENEELFLKYDKEEGFTEEISKILTAKIKQKNQEMNKKYGIKL